MKINFNYDPWRGGFCLRFSNSYRSYVQAAFDNLIVIHLDDRDRITSIESFFGDHGGVPLRGLHKSDKSPEGIFQIEENELRVGSFQLRQSPKKLEVWFSTGNKLPRDHWTERRDVNSGVTTWFSTKKTKGGWPVPGVGGQEKIYMLAGLAVEFDRTAVAFPISSVHLVLEDFK